jgi:hypothetical protein
MQHLFDFLNDVVICQYCHTNLINEYDKNGFFSDRFRCPNKCMCIWKNDSLGWRVLDIPLNDSMSLACYRHEMKILSIQCPMDDTTKWFPPINIPLFDVFSYSRMQLLDTVETYILFS